MNALNRIFAEKRPIVITLAAALVLNVAVYALVVRPLQQKSAGAADRATASRAALKAAEADFAAARALVAGKTQAQEELATFYQKVVPPDQSAARRMTYASLPALARKANVKADQRRYEVVDPQKGARLNQLKIRMVLEGEYENIRRFIYEVETAPQFVIIDDVTLSQNEAGKPLTLTLELSTYYRLTPNGI